MRWERLFLAAAAAHNAVWALFVLAVPERIFDTIPPRVDAFAVLIAAVGACFAVNTFRRVNSLLMLGVVSKAVGPFVFLSAVGAGYLRTSRWPLVIVTDLVWLAPLVLLYRSPRSW